MPRHFKTEVARRFQRAVRLDSDLGAKDSLANYIPLAASLDALARIGEQVGHSAQRAFTWTGPYGGGKSSLALLLSSLLDSDPTVRVAAQRAIGDKTASRIQKAFGVGKRGWLNVPVVGQRDNIVSALDEALTKALNRRFRGRVPGNLAASVRTSAPRFLDRLKKCAEICGANGDGILIIIDEMGRFLEYAALTDGDITFFQELAEIVSRLKEKVVVIGILHQAFEQYALRLGSGSRDEWAKIQGRFVDIPLASGPEETIRLIAQALVGDEAPKSHSGLCKAVAGNVQERRTGLPQDFAQLLSRCWPLHPMVAILLASVSRRRFGQNERSTFGFLNSAEPGGFQEFLKNASSRSLLYGLEDFWGYLRLNLEPAILASSDGHRWAQAVEAIDRAESKGTREHVILAQSIAVLDLFGPSVGLYADDAIVRSGILTTIGRDTRKIVDDLRSWSIVIFRAHTNSWAVFAGSDFDIDAELAVAKSRVEPDFVALQQILTQQVILAKRHYYERGTLRWFDVRICALADAGTLISCYRPTRGACGLLILAIPADGQGADAATIEAQKLSKSPADLPFFVGVSDRSWEIRSLVHDLAALEHVRANAANLEGDQVARREIAARLAGLREQLDQKLSEMLGTARWCRNGKVQEMRSIANLTRAASECATEIFHSSPFIRNELINRTKPSSNAIAAANELMRQMVLNGEKANLNIEGYPPQRAIYASTLATPGIHRRDSDSSTTFNFGAPSSTTIGRTFLPMWNEGEAFLEETEKSRLALSQLYARWAAPPFGIRSGVVPIYALSLILARESELAIYLDGQFIPRLDAFFVDRMLQEPEAVEVRKFRVVGVTRATLEKLAALVSEHTQGKLPIDALAVAKPLVSFVRSLPPWAMRTKTLSQVASACRDCLAKASDPIDLLFDGLPAACGISATADHKKARGALTSYADKLREALDELRAAYPRLIDRISRHIGDQLGGTLATAKGCAEISKRAEVVFGLSGDFRLDSFANRLKIASPNVDWLESICGLAANKPVRDWVDNDIDRAMFEISDLGTRFKRAEAVAESLGRQGDSESVSIVVGQGRNAQPLFQSVNISLPEKEVAKEALTDLLARLQARGLPQSKLLSVVTEIARELILSDKLSDQSSVNSDSFGEVVRSKAWHN